MLARLPPEEREASIHVVLRDGAIRSAGEAVIALCATLPGVRWVPALANRVPGVRRAIAAAYRAVAARRSKLARLVPDVPPTVRRPQG